MYLNNIHYSQNYERAVLGACLLEPAGFGKINNHLHSEVFYFTGNQFVFTCLQEMHDTGIPIDLLTAHDYIERVKGHAFIDNWNTPYYLCRLTQHVVSDLHIGYHGEVIKKMWADRELLKITSTPVKLGESESTLLNIERRIQRLKPLITNKRAIPFKVLRFLAYYIDKAIIRETIHLYGNKYIPGIKKHCIKVDSPLLVYLMHLIDHRYTYTCQGAYDEYLSTDACKSVIPKDSILSDQGGQRMWVDRKYRYPKSFDL